MSRKEFEIIVASAPRKNIKKIDLTFSTQLLAGEQVNIDVYAPIGKVSRTEMILTYYPSIATATAGTKFMALYGGSADFGVVYLEGAFNASLWYRYGEFENATVSKPTQLINQLLAQKDITFDSAQALRFQVKNNTDVADGGVGKTCRLWVVEEILG
jgi:hypothetical protein